MKSLGSGSIFRGGWILIGGRIWRGKGRRGKGRGDRILDGGGELGWRGGYAHDMAETFIHIQLRPFSIVIRGVDSFFYTTCIFIQPATLLPRSLNTKQNTHIEQVYSLQCHLNDK